VYAAILSNLVATQIFAWVQNNMNIYHAKARFVKFCHMSGKLEVMRKSGDFGFVFHFWIFPAGGKP